MAKANKATKILVFWGLCYLIAGIALMALQNKIAALFNAEPSYIFWAGMILTLLGIKDIFIMPLFLKNNTDS